MIKCPFCGISHIANTLFCNACGTYLLDDDRRETDPLDIDATRRRDEAKEKAEINPLINDKEPSTIRLRIGEEKREVEAALDNAFHLGRLDPASDIFPEVDLTHDNGAAKGVSRRHVRILKKAGAVVVEDTGSINGTFINGQRLPPYLPEVLRPGDQLQLGKLLIEVELD